MAQRPREGACPGGVGAAVEKLSEPPAPPSLATPTQRESDSPLSILILIQFGSTGSPCPGLATSPLPPCPSHLQQPSPPHLPCSKPSKSHGYQFTTLKPSYMYSVEQRKWMAEGEARFPTWSKRLQTSKRRLKGAMWQWMRLGTSVRTHV